MSLRRTIELGLVLCAPFAAANACGGTTITGDGSHGGSGIDGGDITSGRGASTGGATSKPSCGNGSLDIGEVCDGMDLAGRTCATASMGNYTSGTLRCTAKCTFDVTGCTSAGTGGSVSTGGTLGAGGYVTRGGSAGVGGYVGTDTEAGAPPIATCGPGSAPDPRNPTRCTASDGGVPACEYWVSRELRSAPCGVCGCVACPSELSNCLTDPQCAAIERCIQANGCYDATSCQGPCANVLSTTTSSAPAFQKALTFDRCWEQAGCAVGCRDAGVSGPGAR